jgi:MinD-like ATPase involved in chromosome partitioning or flagellar assembly
MHSEGESRPPRQGQIVTFYSYKGGTGRTMALANVAWILAANGSRVLIADWDLESPGLHRFFQPFIDTGVSERPGIIDIIRRYAFEVVESPIDLDSLFGREEEKKAARDAISGIVEENVHRVNDYAIQLNWEFPQPGSLHFLSPGKLTNGDYQATLSSLDWDNFYDNLAGGEFFDALRAALKRTYDYVLIDSRTGLGDVSDICTVHLPDIVVDCFTLATQGIEGAAMIARTIPERTKRRKITILPVPMRIDHTQKDRVDAGLAFAAQQFDKLLPEMSHDERHKYLAEVEVPYRAAYAYEETLAAFADRPGSQAGLLPYYERMAARITAGAVTTLPPREEWLRLRTRLLFSRTQSASPSELVVDFSPEDQLWAEWITAVLASAEIKVRLIGETSAAPADSDAETPAQAPAEETPVAETPPEEVQDEETPVPTQTVAIVSESYLARRQDSPPDALPDLLISVTDTRLPRDLAEIPAVFLAPLSEEQAVERLVDHFKGRRPAEAESGIGSLRYPGGDRSQIVNIPTRNANFTGRDNDLRKLRDELRARRVAVVLPLTIHGLGGVGKTQLALEYVHRFKADYDIIWWMNCAAAQYVDASLADLGQRMREQLSVDVPEEGGISEVVQKVLQLLNEGRAGQRWLLVYDNAEDIDELRKLLPSSHGHVLITSRNERWLDLGRSLPVNVFKREESIAHLRRRKPAISEEEADQVASVLKDIPLAVAAAGALLASTEMSVPEYLAKLQQQPRLSLPEGHPLLDYPPAVTSAWNLSLDQLQENSAAASRLLEICSVMAPGISLELINTQAMTDALRDLDPAISEQAMIARLIRQIDLLALVKVDNNAREIQVHNVVQAVVNVRLTAPAKDAARRAAHLAMVEIRPKDVDDPQTWPRYRLIWPHLRPSEAMWSTDARVRQLLIERVRYIRQREDLARGQRRANEIQQAWKAMLAGTPDPAMPASEEMVKGKLQPEQAEELLRQLYRLQFNLANILRDRSDFQESRRVDQEVLAGQIEHLGPEHLHTLNTRSSLAADFRALGQYDEALKQDQETYRVWSNGYGEEYPGTLSAAHNLALSFLLSGDFRNALAQDRLTLERRTAVQGPLHPRTLNSGASVARDLLEAGRYGEAVTRMETVWALSRDTLGDNDRNTLTARLLLGVALRCAGHPELAGSHIDSARIGLTRGFGEDSSDVLACRLSQALNWLATGRLAEARDAAEKVLVVYEARLKSDHPHTLICRLDISTALCLEKEYEAAESEARIAADGLRDRLGHSHPYTLAANMVLASLLARQDNLLKAEELEAMVVAEREQALGPQHPDTLRCRANLLLTLHAQGVDGASAKRQEVLGDLATLIGSEHPDVTTALKGDRLLCAIDPLPF